MNTAALRTESQNNSFNSSRRSSPLKQTAAPGRQLAGRKEPTPVTAKISSSANGGVGRSPSPDLGTAFIGGRALTKQALDVNERLNVSKGTQRSTTPAAAPAPAAASGPDDAMTNRINKLMKLSRADGRPEMYRVDMKEDSDLKYLHELRTRRDPLLDTRPAKASPAGAARRNEGTNKVVGLRDDADTRSADGSVASTGSNARASRRRLVGPPSPMQRVDSGNSSLGSGGKRMVDSPSNKRQQPQIPPWESPAVQQQQQPLSSRQHYPVVANAQTTTEAKQISSIRLLPQGQGSSSSQGGGVSARGASPSDAAGRASGSRGASATAIPRPTTRTKEVIEAMQRQDQQPSAMPPSHYRFQKGRQQSPLNHVIFPDRPDAERMDTSAASVLPEGSFSQAFNRNEQAPKHILAGKVVWLGRAATPRGGSSARRAASSDPNELSAQQPAAPYRRAARSVTPPGPSGRRGSSGIFDGPSSAGVPASLRRSKVIGHQLHHLTSPENTLVSSSAAVGVGSPTQLKSRSIQTKVVRYSDCMSGGAVVEKVDPPAHYGKRQASFQAAPHYRMADALSWGH